MSAAVTSAPREKWDVALTSFLVVFGVVLAPLAALLVLLSGFATDACSETNCDYQLLSTSYYIGFYAPSVILLVTVVILLIRFAHRRRGWWIALICIGLMLAITVGSVLLTDFAVRNPGQTLF